MEIMKLYKDGIISERLKNCLVDAGIENIHDLSNYREKELLGIKNFGVKTLRELQTVLYDYFNTKLGAIEKASVVNYSVKFNTLRCRAGESNVQDLLYRNSVKNGRRKNPLKSNRMTFHSLVRQIEEVSAENVAEKSYSTFLPKECWKFNRKTAVKILDIVEGHIESTVSKARDRKIYIMRMGLLHSYEPQKLHQIGKKYKLTDEGVRRVLKSCRRKVESRTLLSFNTSLQLATIVDDLKRDRSGSEMKIVFELLNTFVNEKIAAKVTPIIGYLIQTDESSDRIDEKVANLMGMAKKGAKSSQ